MLIKKKEVLILVTGATLYNSCSSIVIIFIGIHFLHVIPISTNSGSSIVTIELWTAKVWFIGFSKVAMSATLCRPFRHTGVQVACVFPSNKV